MVSATLARNVLTLEARQNHLPGADFTTFASDKKQLHAELPASVTSAVAADRGVISKALASLAPPTHREIPDTFEPVVNRMVRQRDGNV